MNMVSKKLIEDLVSRSLSNEKESGGRGRPVATLDYQFTFQKPHPYLHGGKAISSQEYNHFYCYD